MLKLEFVLLQFLKSFPLILQFFNYILDKYLQAIKRDSKWMRKTWKFAAYCLHSMDFACLIVMHFAVFKQFPHRLWHFLMFINLKIIDFAMRSFNCC